MRRDSPREGVAPVQAAGVAVLAGAAVAIGALERLWVATHPIGTLTSDAGVIGLMGMQLLHHGQLTAYMWGQSYSGSLEAVLTAAVFLVAGIGTSQLLATTALSSALAALALWRAGRRIVGDPAAGIGALAFWVWPTAFIWRALKPGGTYMIGLAVALCAVGALARVRQGDDGWLRVGLAGAWCGLAFWQSPMCVQLLLPCALWCLPALVRLRVRLAALIVGGVVGGLPVVWFGATHHWSNFHLPGPRDMLGTVPVHLLHFFDQEAPIVLGFRLEASLHWVGGAFFGIGISVVAAVAFLAVTVFVLIRRSGRLVLPVLTLWILPLLYSLNPLTSRSPAGRYAMFGASMLSVLVGVGLVNLATLVPRRLGSGDHRSAGLRSDLRSVLRSVLRPVLRRALLWPAGLAALAMLGIVGLRDLPRQLVEFGAPDVKLPLDDGALQRLVETHHLRYAFAQYWIAYRVTFETAEAVDATPYDYDRYPPLAAPVRSSSHPAWIFVSASVTLPRFEHWCSGRGIRYVTWSDGGFTVVQPVERVLPDDLPHTVLYPRSR